MLTDVVISARSSNRKTGPMPTISRPIETTCPRTCPFLPKALGGNGACYANGRQNGTVRKFASDLSIDDAAAKISKGKHKGGEIRGEYFGPAKYIRDRVVGDIAREDGTADVQYLLDVATVAAKTGLTAYGYTHAFDMLTRDDVATVADAGYVLNASCNTADDIARAIALGMPTTYAGDDVQDGDVIAGRRVITCPEQTGRVRSCADCGLCAKPARAVTVRFLMH